VTASAFSEEIAATICDRLMGGESLRDICEDEGFPSARTVHRWLADPSPERDPFRQQYAHAREVQADTLFDEILTIADDARNDWMVKRDYKGENIGWQENGEAMQRSRLRVDARKWMAGKLRPKVYGEKLDLNHSGNVTVNVLRFTDA